MNNRSIYRKFHNAEDLKYFNVRVEQTDLQIGAERDLSAQAEASIRRHRADIEEYIKRYPAFLTTLKPWKQKGQMPAIINRMCRASNSVKVGPMAAIAGVMAQMVTQDILKFSKNVVVENGGDLYIAGNVDRIAAIYTGDDEKYGHLGIKISSDMLPIGICTSSGKIGHSLSFGSADAVVVLSPDAALCDAAATSAGNMIKTAADIEGAISFLKRIDGIKGVLAAIDGAIGAWGAIELVKLK